MVEFCKVQNSISHIKAEKIILTNCTQMLKPASNNIEPEQDNNQETDTMKFLGDIIYRNIATFVSQIM